MLTFFRPRLKVKARVNVDDNTSFKSKGEGAGGEKIDELAGACDKDPIFDIEISDAITNRSGEGLGEF